MGKYLRLYPSQLPKYIPEVFTIPKHALGIPDSPLFPSQESYIAALAVGTLFNASGVDQPHGSYIMLWKAYLSTPRVPSKIQYSMGQVAVHTGIFPYWSCNGQTFRIVFFYVIVLKIGSKSHCTSVNLASMYDRLVNFNYWHNLVSFFGWIFKCI